MNERKPNMNALYDSVIEKLKELNLPAFAKNLKFLEDTDPKLMADLLDAVNKMADDELAGRLEKRIARYTKAAGLVRVQTVDSFDFTYNQATKKLKTRYLKMAATDITKQGVGAVFIGNSGLGKTHLARAIGYATCQRGKRVLFRPCSTILNDLVAAEATKNLSKEVKRLVTPALLIIDELAYVHMSTEEANLFYQVISRRHDHNRPTVVTTNKPFSEWNQAFKGDAIAHAIVDRLTERSEIFYLEGKSYRQTHRKGIK